MSFELTGPGVSLTDFALAIECTVFTVLLIRRPANDPVLRGWFVAFYHVIQGVALWMIYRAAKWIAGAQPVVRRTHDIQA
jgi:hypothetical protein